MTINKEANMENKCELSIQIKSEKDDYKTDNYEKSFSSEQKLKTQIWAVHEGHNNDKICNLCGKLLSTQIKLKNHLEIPHDDKCNICEKSFPSVPKLKMHNHEIHQSEKELLKCDLCCKVFVCSSLKQRKFDLKKHITGVHPYEKPIPSGQKLGNQEGHKEKACNLCGKSLSKQIKLKKHLEISHDHKCDNCKKSFLFAHTLKTHIWTVHEGHTEKTCNLCGKSLSKQIKLEQHLEIPHDHKCIYCKKSFLFAQTLKTHFWTIHEGQKDKTCNLCAKTLFSQTKLEKHLEIPHDHKCIMCEKSFPSVPKLKKHNHEIHQSEKELLKCELCGKVFAYSSLKQRRFYLKKHITVTHPYEKSILLVEKLGKHNHEVHQNKTKLQSEKELIKCDICGKFFMRSSLKKQKHSLNNHILVEHPINLTELKHEKLKEECIETSNYTIEKIEIKEEECFENSNYALEKIEIKEECIEN